MSSMYIFKMASVSYSKEVNRWKNRVYNSNAVNHRKTLLNATLRNVKSGKYSVDGVRNNGVRMSDLLASYGRDGISECDIPWGSLNGDVIDELNRQEVLWQSGLASGGSSGSVVVADPVKLKISLKVKPFNLVDHVTSPLTVKGEPMSPASLGKYSNVLRCVQSEWCVYDVVEFMKRLGADPLGALEVVKRHYEKYVDLLYAVNVLIKYSVYGVYLLPGLLVYKSEAEVYYYLRDVELKRKTNVTKLKLSWSEAMAIYDEVALDKPYSQKHLLLSMLLLMPPLRDDLGNIRVCDKVMPGENCYVRGENRLILRDQKMVSSKGLAVVELPGVVVGILEESLRRYPRDYLITQKSGDIYEKGKIWRLVSRRFGYSLNDFRKTYTTHVIDDLDLSVSGKIALLKASLHTVKVAIDLYYFPGGN